MLAWSQLCFLVYNLELKNYDDILKALHTEIKKMENDTPIIKLNEFNSALMKEYKLFAELFTLNKKNKV